MCADKQVCEFDPKLNQSSVTVQAPTQPFPITLAMNSPVVLKMDFNIDASIQSTDLSISPMISLMRLPPPSSSGGDQGDEEMEIVGTITLVDQTAHPETIPCKKVAKKLVPLAFSWQVRLNGNRSTGFPPPTFVVLRRDDHVGRQFLLLGRDVQTSHLPYSAQPYLQA